MPVAPDAAHFPNRRVLLGAMGAICAPVAGNAQPAPPARLPMPPLPTGTKAIKDITYVTRASGPLALDLYLPAARGAHPVILWIHGGGWFAGDRSDAVALYFLAQNYAVASIDYRLADQAAFPAPLLDCKAALRWLRANAGQYSLDANRIVAAGPMSGGHLSSMLGVTAADPHFHEGSDPAGDDSVQGVMALYGVHDIIAWRGMIGGVDHDQPGTSESRMLGAFVLERPDLARAASPTHYVSAKAPPFLLVHGHRDERVPWTQSKLMDSALKLAGVQSELWLEEQAVHADPMFWSETGRARMARFFQRALQLS